MVKWFLANLLTTESNFPNLLGLNGLNKKEKLCIMWYQLGDQLELAGASSPCGIR